MVLADLNLKYFATSLISQSILYIHTKVMSTQTVKCGKQIRVYAGRIFEHGSTCVLINYVLELKDFLSAERMKNFSQ